MPFLHIMNQADPCTICKYRFAFMFSFLIFCADEFKMSSAGGSAVECFLCSVTSSFEVSLVCNMVAIAIFVHTCNVLKKKWISQFSCHFPSCYIWLTLQASSRYVEQSPPQCEKHKAPRFLGKSILYMSGGADWRLEKFNSKECFIAAAVHELLIMSVRCCAHVC